MKKVIVLFLVFLFCLASNINASIKVNKIVKIGILLDVKKVNIASDKKYIIYNNTNKIVISPGNIDIKLIGNKVVVGANKKVLDLPVKVKAESYVAINKKIYRGDVLLTLSKKKKLNVINELDIEDYLKGILPKEVSPCWPLETLKAQAVISRSYTIKNLLKHSSQNFNLCSSVHCQVYGGASIESKITNKAVLDTKGEVLTYKNDIAQTLFHASCGGWTEDPKAVWGWAAPEYLKGIKDKYCKDSPHQKWSCSIEEKTIRNKLKNAGYKIGEISKISCSGNTPGHAKQNIIIKHKDGTLTLNSYKFRTIVDDRLIKSTMIKNIKKQNNKFNFTGNGWGHKIGLCQWGSKAMGEKKISYKKILEFYYPKTSLRQIEYDNK